MRLKGLNTLRGNKFKKTKLASQSFVSNSVIMLVSRPNTDSIIPSVGFIVTKKNGNAVQRNFLKRRLRSVATKIIANVANKEHSYILIARSRLLDYPFANLERDVLYCLKNAKVKALG